MRADESFSFTAHYQVGGTSPPAFSSLRRRTAKGWYHLEEAICTLHHCRIRLLADHVQCTLQGNLQKGIQVSLLETRCPPLR